jgi:hypothetical protein
MTVLFRSMKTCTKCGIEKDLSEFARRKNLFNSMCKVCKKAYNLTWYQNNSRTHKANVRKNNDRYRESIKEVVDAIKSVPCSDCKGTFPPFVMDFDHRSDKTMNVSRMVAGCYKVASVLKEIEKCDVVCANCHRVRTHNRLVALP